MSGLTTHVLDTMHGRPAEGMALRLFDSRKPIIAKRDPVTGMSRLGLDDDAENDGGAAKEPKLTPEEIRARQKRERDEKQRRYDEARAKIFGESNPSSGASSPATR